MKYNIAILFILLGALSLSCAKIDVATGEEEKTVKFTFQATREEIETETKTYLKNGVSIGWNVGDVVKLFLLHEENTETEGIKDSTYINGSATVSGFNESTGIATFDASITVPEGAPVGNYEMFAVYGTIRASTNIFGITDKSGSRNFRLSVLREQNANEGSFDPRYANCVAHANEVTVEDGVVTIPSDLKFYNCFALAGLKIKENGDKIDSVVLSTNVTSDANERHLAQHYYLKYRDPDNISVPEFKWSSAMGRDIVMKGQLSNATYYFVVSPTNTVYKGDSLKLTFFHSGSSYIYTKAKISTSSKAENPFQRSSIFLLNSAGFNIPDLVYWKGFQNEKTTINHDETSVSVNFKTYESDKDNWTFDIIGSDFTATGASVETEGTGAEKTLHINLPTINKSQKDIVYLVTATDKDENVGRTICSEIIQKKSDKVYFGTTWGKSFHDACIEDFNGSKTKGPFEGITFVTYPSKTLTTSSFRGNMQFYFVAAESGEATMTFAKIRTPKPTTPPSTLSDTLKKATQFFVNSELRTYIYTNQKDSSNATVNLGQITAGDTIKFKSTSGNDHNYVYPASDGKLFDFKKVEE